MAARVKIVPPALSAEREKLREAIEHRDQLKNRVDGLQAASDLALRDGRTQRDDLAALKIKLVEAEERATNSVVARAQGRPALPGQTVAQAKQAIADLEDAVEAGARARELIAAQLRTKDFEAAQIHVEAAASAALWASPEVMRLLRDLEVATATALEIRAALDVCGAIPNALLLKYATINPPFSEQRAATWRVAKAKLMNDATAELPS